MSSNLEQIIWDWNEVTKDVARSRRKRLRDVSFYIN